MRYPGFGGQLKSGPALPSPNIWHWPEVYEQENRAQDADGVLWAALAEAAPWAGLDVVDVGCGDGFHLPRFAEQARSVVGVEPHPPLVVRARARGLDVRRGGAEALPLPDGSADVVHARTAYFFGAGCEPGLAEADRVLRPGGILAIIDLDFTVPPYGDWLRADLPRYDPAGVERFFARQGFDQRRITSTWRFAERATLEAVLRIEFAPATAERAIAATPGLTIPVGYRLHTRRRPTGLLHP
ncbi:class I SAM-dependent methyltransferase [Pseudonocardia xishanensis]|uniref:Class I SAM-dependent methyltransferase n=1 Tax=Pseudonocardia xishanensis TaxID=630995 RepID=A0ABP8RVY9_9PSEU